MLKNEFFDGVRGVINIANDIGMYGCGDKKEPADINYDRNLVQLLEKCAEHDLWLSSVTCIEHKLTHKGVEPDPAKVAAFREMSSSNRQSGRTALRGNVPIAVQIRSQPVWNSLAIEEPYQRWLCIYLVWKSGNSV